MKTGVSSSTARTVSDLVVRPVEVVLVVVVALVIASLGSRLIRRALGHVARHATTRSSTAHLRARAATVVSLVANVWRFFVAIVAVSTILGIMGVDLTPVLASATVIGATIGFGAQSLVRDYLSGILITLEDQFGIGDSIAVGTTVGVVEDLNLRVTRLRGADGSTWYVPNGEIRVVANTSRGWAAAVIDVPITRNDTVALERARDALTRAARAVAEDPRFASSMTTPPEVRGVVAVDADTCTWRVALRTTASQRDQVERALREACVGAIADATRTSAGDPAPPPDPPGTAGTDTAPAG
jgi:small conductance mechanosensitive channel